MKWISGIFLILIFSCGQSPAPVASSNNSPEKKLRTGIYLQADSLTPGAVKFTVDKPAGRIFYTDTVALLNENDFQHITIEAHGISFELAFTEQGALRHEQMQEKYAGKIVDVIVANRLIGSYYVYQSGPSGLSRDSIDLREGLLVNQAWAEKSSDSLNKVWRARPQQTRLANGISKEYYTNGKLFRQVEYKDSAVRSERTFFESGQVAYELFVKDTSVNGVSIESYNKKYYLNGNLKEEYYGSALYPVLYRTYYKNGNMKYESIGQVWWYTGAEYTRYYSENGDLVFEQHAFYPEQLPCGDKGEFNHPRVYSEKHFENKLLVEETEFYSDCGECDIDTSGVWKFYEWGKLVRTKKYPSWKQFYKDACNGAE